MYMIKLIKNLTPNPWLSYSIVYIYIDIDANFIKHNRHFMSTYFLLDPFEFLYYFYRIRGELIYVLSIVVCIPCTFCPTLGHHQGRIYPSQDTKEVLLWPRKNLGQYSSDVCCVWEMSGDMDGLPYWLKFFSRPYQHFFRILAWVAQPELPKALLGCSTGLPKAFCLQLVLTSASCLQLTRTARAPGYIIF